jgi:hypothetical protein
VLEQGKRNADEVCVRYRLHGLLVALTRIVCTVYEFPFTADIVVFLCLWVNRAGQSMAFQKNLENVLGK